MNCPSLLQNVTSIRAAAETVMLDQSPALSDEEKEAQPPAKKAKPSGSKNTKKPAAAEEEEEEAPPLPKTSVTSKGRNVEPPIRFKK